ncbi:MAG: serine/threonine-protein kinase [Phycisphaerales bacterium]|nr:serine/threonine-protein kinase [Phycisphaerales bacterium]
MSTINRFQLVDRLFRAALRLSAEEREGYLDGQCAGDSALKAEVLTLLQEDKSVGGALDAPALGRPIDLGFIHEAQRRGDPLPERIGHYRILRVIGEGGMGVVYEAEQDQPRRRVALKVIRPEMVTPRLRHRFRQEVHALGQLTHPGIAQIYDASTADQGEGGQAYFVMELVAGEPLLEFAQARRLSTPQRLELMAKICDAVSHAHQHGVIHRDLKPANILVVDAPSEAHGLQSLDFTQPKVLDFGVARATEIDLQTITLQTNTGQLIGTLPYMSPEQAGGDTQQIDARSDLYALGVIAYELLAGRLPYDVRHKLMHEAVRVIQETDPTSLSSLDRALGGDLETIIRKALAKEKSRRYGSVAEFAADLRRFLNHEPIAARRPSRSYLLRKFARRNKTPVAAAVTIAFILIAATVVSTVFAIQRSNQRDRAVAAQLQWKKRFDDVRTLANIVLFDVDELLASTAGTTPARELLATTAQTYLDSLVDEAGDDPNLQLELAQAYLRVGDIQGHPNRPNLGHIERAQHNYERALQICRQLETGQPKNLDIQMRLAEPYGRLSVLCQYLQQPEASIRHAQEQIGIIERVLATDPGRVEARGELPMAYALVGDTSRKMGRTADAHEAYRKALQLAEALIEVDPNRARAQRILSVACNDLGRVLMDMEQSEEALGFFQRSLDIRQALLDANPDDVRARRDLLLCHHNLARVCQEQDKLTEALEHHLAAERTASDIAAADPQNLRAKHDLSVCQEKVGDVLKSLDRFEESMASFVRCVETRRVLVRQSPQNSLHRAGLAIGLERVADVMRLVGRDSEALPRYNEAAEIATELVNQDPKNALHQTLVHMVASKIGSMNRARGQDSSRMLAERREALEQAILWLQRSVDQRAQAEQLQVRLMASPDFDVDAALKSCRDELAGSGAPTQAQDEPGKEAG